MNDTAPLSTPGALTLRGIRVGEALARFAGNEQRFRHWLLDFGDYGPATARQIRSAITDGASERAIKLTHAFKGHSGMLGMDELHSIALSLEMTLKNGEPTELWLDELERTVAEMTREIQARLGGAGD